MRGPLLELLWDLRSGALGRRGWACVPRTHGAVMWGQMGHAGLRGRQAAGLGTQESGHTRAGEGLETGIGMPQQAAGSGRQGGF